MAEKLDTTISYWTEYVIYEGELPFPLAVCVSYQQGNRGKHGLFVRAYVACDLTDRTPKGVEALYQKRVTSQERSVVSESRLGRESGDIRRYLQQIDAGILVLGLF